MICGFAMSQIIHNCSVSLWRAILCDIRRKSCQSVTNWHQDSTDCTFNVLSTFNPKWVQNRNKGKAFWLSFVVEYDNIFLNFGKSIISSIQDLGPARHLRVVFWDLRVIMGSGKAWMLCYLNNYLEPACFLHQCGSAPSYPRPGVLTGFLENNN